MAAATQYATGPDFDQEQLLSDEDVVAAPTPVWRERIGKSVLVLIAIAGAACLIASMLPFVAPVHTRAAVRALNTVCGPSGCITCTPGGGCTAAPCFPGEAIVEVRGRGAAAISTLETGEEVLVDAGSGRFGYEPVWGFLHKVPGDSVALAVSHETGDFRASDSHLVFVAKGPDGVRTNKRVDQLMEGDVFFSKGVEDDFKPSKVLSVRRVMGSGMYAPLTQSGTVVVDGVVASTYAAPLTKGLPHGAAHAAFFLVRAYHDLGLNMAQNWLFKTPSKSAPQLTEEMHPFAAFMYHHLRLDKLLA